MSRVFALSSAAGAAVVAATLFASGRAAANGRFPFGNQLVIDPKDPTHMVARTTYGLLETTDGSKSWGWICETGAGYAPTEDPFVGITADGTLLAASTLGMLESSDHGCAWSAAPEFASSQARDLVVERGDPSHALSMRSTVIPGADGGGGYLSNALYETTDSGKSWHAIGTPLTHLSVSTLEVAPTDSKRLYVSATSEDGKAVLEQSNDRGTTWNVVTPAWGTAYSAWVSSVDPAKPDVVYVRLKATSDTMSTATEAAGADRLGVFHAADGSWRDILIGGPGDGRTGGAPYGLVSFALSPDGKKIAVGGNDDNLHIIATDTWADEKVSDIHPLCLTWASDGLYACGFAQVDLFVVARSCDEGKTFQHFLEWEHFCPLTCPAGTSTGDKCLAVWNEPDSKGFKEGNNYDDSLCMPTGSAPSTAAYATALAQANGGAVADPFACGSMPAATDAGADGSAMPGPTDAAADATGVLPSPAAQPESGCGCRLAGAKGAAPIGAAGFAAFAVARVARARRRKRTRTGA